ATIFKPRAKPVERRFSSSINSLSAKPSTARRSAGAPMVEYWAVALSKDAAPTHGAQMSTGVLSACGRIAPLYLRAGFRRMLRRSVHGAWTNKARLGTRHGSVVDLKFLPL